MRAWHRVLLHRGIADVDLFQGARLGVCLVGVLTTACVPTSARCPRVAGTGEGRLPTTYLMSLGEPSRPSLRIVVASEDLAPGTPLRTSLLRVEPPPAGFKWAGHLRPVDIVHFAGTRVRRAIRKGEAIRRVDLAGYEGGPSKVPKVFPPGTRTVTLSVDWVGGLGTWVQAGDHVDIGAIFGLDRSRPVLRMLLQRVRVVAAEQWAGKPGTGAAGRVRWVMVLTLAREAQALALAQRLGKIVLFPRGARDRRPVRYPPVTRQHLESPGFWLQLQQQRRRLLGAQAPDDPGIRFK